MWAKYGHLTFKGKGHYWRPWFTRTVSQSMVSLCGLRADIKFLNDRVVEPKCKQCQKLRARREA